MRVIYDNWTHYVIYLHYMLVICYLVKFFLLSVCYYQTGEIKLYNNVERWKGTAIIINAGEHWLHLPAAA